jgi:tetratricopeptide (TPR) repeat protein
MTALVAGFLAMVVPGAEEPPAGGGAGAHPAIRSGHPVEGRLERTDARLSGKGPHRAFRFVPARTGKVVVRMESRDLDAYIIIRGEFGETLAEDDDSGPGDGSQVVLEVEAAKEYTVVAGSRPDAAQGSFRLEVLDGEAGTLTYGDELIRDLAWYEEAARAGISLSRKIQVLNQAARCHMHLGTAKAALGVYGEALAIARETRDRRSEGRILGNLGSAHKELGQTETAIQHYESALRIHTETGNRGDEGLVLGNLGNAHEAMGRSIAAVDCYEKALEIHREVRNRRDEGIVLGNLGGSLKSLGRLDEAIQCLESALEVHLETGNRRSEGFVVRNLANVHRALGSPEKALELHERALEIHREAKDLRSEGAAHSGLGSVHLELGNPAKAIEHHARALEIARQTADLRDEGVVLGNLGNAYRRLGEPHRAIQHFELALEIHRRTRNRTGEALALGGLGNACRELGRLEKAVEAYEDALRAHRETRYTAGLVNVLASLGVVHADLLQMDRAIESCEEGLRIGRESRHRGGEARLLWQMGKIRARLGEDAGALDAFRSAHAIDRETLEGVSRALSESAYQSLGARMLEHGVADYLHLLVKVFRSAESPAEREALAAEALHLVESFRARTLASSLRAGDVSRLLSPEGREVWSRLGALRQENAGLVRSALEDLPEEGDRRKEALARFRKECEAREDEMASLERRLKAAEPKYAGLFAGGATATDLSGSVAPGEVLLHYNLAGKKAVVLVWSHRKGPYLQALDADVEDLEARVAALLLDMRPRDGKLADAQDLEERLRRLRADLFRGLEDRLEGARSILIVPDGSLHLFPFEALVTEDGGYLVEKLEVRYAPSMGVLLELKRRGETAAKEWLVLAGDPDFGEPRPEDGGVAIALRVRGGASFRKLEHAGAEVDRIAGLFEEKTVLRGVEATEARFKEEAPRATLLHVVTHGKYEQAGEGNALFYSGLAFAGLNGGGDGKDDGFLTASEVMALDLRAVDLAVLSACDTALGRLQGHEGKFGLERAFFVAGVRAFLGSLWRVDDGATAEFMGRLYGRLNEGKPRAEALRLTKLDFIRGRGHSPASRGTRGERGIGLAPKAGRDWSHPYYWAPFVVSGDAGAARRDG